MMIFSALAWLMTECVKLLLKIGIVCTIVLVTGVFIGEFIAFLCQDGAQAEEGAENAAEEQVSRPEDHDGRNHV